MQSCCHIGPLSTQLVMLLYMHLFTLVSEHTFFSLSKTRPTHIHVWSAATTNTVASHMHLRLSEARDLIAINSRKEPLSLALKPRHVASLVRRCTQLLSRSQRCSI